jgi:hypothetical protein
MNVPKNRFDGNVSSEIRVDTCRQTDMTELTGAFLDCANAPKTSPTMPYRGETVGCREHHKKYYSVCRKM